mmetsp:Transcript_11686/g.27999  ORF Transcript_11686/g.27999 Transcript_11686/m.27999 type:complete len:516 (-) Transcript_11686:987-2534(-)
MSSSSSSSSSHSATTLWYGSKEELIKSTTIAGRGREILKKFILTKEQVEAILEGIRSVAEISDITLLIVVGWFLVPLIETWYARTMTMASLAVTSSSSSSSSSSISSPSGSELFPNKDGAVTFGDEIEEEYLDPITQIDPNKPPTAQSLQQQQLIAPQQYSQPSSSNVVLSSPKKISFSPLKALAKMNTRPFHRTKLFHVVNTLSEMARLGLAVYGVDMLKIVLLGAGFDIPKSTRITHAFAYTAYTIWMFQRISTFKRYVIHKLYKYRSSGSASRSTSSSSDGEIVTPIKDDRGRLQLIDRLIDAGLILLTAFVLLEILNFEFGVAVKGVVAVGSVWTLVVSLAMKEIVSNFFNGILLSASDRIYEGDTVQISKSGFRGHVERLGWLETVLRGNDDIMMTVPNAELQGSQVSNLSRIRICQVHQTLKFKSTDVSKLPKLLHDIKCEIRSSCPTVITDGSRPFRCYWTNFQSSSLEVVIDAHFRIRPVGDAYFENRQRVLFAIDRAVKMNEVQYA